jgi:hypothetical protein
MRGDDLQGQRSTIQAHSDTIKVRQHVCRVRYGTLRQSWSGRMKEDYGFVKELRPGVWKVCLVAPLPVWPTPPATFLDVLRGWGHTWIWNEMKAVGGMDWLAQAISGGALIAVTDGSCIREHYPDLCSTC